MTLRQTSPWQPSPTTSTSKTNTKIKNKDKNKEKTKTKDNYFKTDITLAAITKTSSLANRCPMQDLSFTCSQTQDKKVKNIFLVCHFNCQKKMEMQQNTLYFACAELLSTKKFRSVKVSDCLCSPQSLKSQTPSRFVSKKHCQRHNGPRVLSL